MTLCDKARSIKLPFLADTPLTPGRSTNERCHQLVLGTETLLCRTQMSIAFCQTPRVTQTSPLGIQRFGCTAELAQPPHHDISTLSRIPVHRRQSRHKPHWHMICIVPGICHGRVLAHVWVLMEWLTSLWQRGCVVAPSTLSRWY